MDVHYLKISQKALKALVKHCKDEEVDNVKC